jgi:D-alanine-D-alanine ligase
MIHKARRTDIPVLLLHNVDPQWDTHEIEQALMDAKIMKNALSREGHLVVDVQVNSRELRDLIKPYDPDKYIVLNWCEEIPGCPKSDIDVVALLTEMSYTYTGPPADVLALTWDKKATKEILQKNGVTTPVGRVVSLDQVDEWTCFPSIVKPSCEHCSIGVTEEAIITNRQDLRERIRYVEDVFKQPALVEDFIEGREFHVTLWGNKQTEMLPPAEMDFSGLTNRERHLCTYDSKFNPGSEDYEKIELVIPAPLDQDQFAQIERLAHKCYKTIGCRDYARIDLRLRDNTFYVLDVNPNADLSPETSSVYAAAAKGITYGEFTSRLVNLAAERHPIFGAS